MSRDRSLDEFIGSESGAAESDTAAESAADAGGSESTPGNEGGDGGDTDAPPNDGHDAAGPDGAEPAAVTYRWGPGGVQCTECGATVDRVWSGESGPVCVGCKEW